MNSKVNWENVEEGGKRLLPGGYVCKITGVEDEPTSASGYKFEEQLELWFDIAEGDFAGMFDEQFKKSGFWPWRAKFRQSYKSFRDGRPNSFFKGMLNRFEESNPGFKFNNDENAFKGKLIGLVISEREYETRDGNIGIAYDYEIKNVEDIRSGNYEVPPKKLLPEDKRAKILGFEEAVEEPEDMPF